MKLRDCFPDPMVLRKPAIRYRIWVFSLGILGALLLSAPAGCRRFPHASEGTQKPVNTKRIPDARVLHGSPPTIIDLEGVFAERDFAEGGGTLGYEVIRNKDDTVVKARTEGTRLILEWVGVGDSEIILRVTNSQSKKILDNKFLVEVWEPKYLQLALTVIGGLGVFLLGMKNMSDGLQGVAGAGLRRMISAVTDNRLLAAGVGTAVTMMIQSSSITTVMVVGFVNSGFMTLSQAVGVIMGANIGTTITGWILVLKIGKYGLPMLGCGAFIYLFSKGDRLRFGAMALMGVGMIFFGLELMKDGFSTIKDLPVFVEWFQSFTADTYLGVLQCASVGCVLTLVIQSSSATLGITMGLAIIGVIPLETAAALVLGNNVGTTVTAWLASFGTTTAAKRAAYFHILFNTLGVLWVTAIFRLPFFGEWGYFPLVKWISGQVVGVDAGTGVIKDVAFAIALTHTLFNVANLLLFLPFARQCAALLEYMVPQKAVKEKPHLTSLDVRMLETSAIAIEQSRVEVLRMAFGCNRLMGWVKEISSQEVPNQKLVQKAFHREEVLDTIQDEIVAFMAHLLSGSVPHDVADEARRQLRMADEYESVSDYLINILKSHLKLEKSGLRLPQEDFQELLGLHDMVADYLALIGRGYEQRQPEVITKARSQGDAITHHVKELRSQFLAQMSEQKLDPQVVVAYNAQLNAYRRVREHALNVAEAIAGEK